MPNTKRRSEDLKGLRDRLANRQQQKVVSVDAEKPAAIVQAPVHGLKSIAVRAEDLPNTDNLPNIPERLRDFAFNYAMTQRSLQSYAEQYNCSKSQISRWLRNPGVQAYIALTKFEKRHYLMGQRIVLDRLIFKRMCELLEMPIDGENSGAIVRALEFCYKVLHNPEGAAGKIKKTVVSLISRSILQPVEMTLSRLHMRMKEV